VKPFVNGSLQLYRVLVKVYPAPLRHRYAAEMVDVFEEQLAGAWLEHGVYGLVRVWGSVLGETLQGPAALRLSQALVSVPVISLLSSSVLFLLFFWANGAGRPCR